MKTNMIERFSFLAIFAIAFCIPVVALAQQDDDRESGSSARISPIDRFSKRADQFAELVQPVAGSAAASTVEIIGETKTGRRKRIVYGTVVDSGGYIVTKASELAGDIECQMSNGVKLKATVFGIDHETDLALLKVDASGLSEIQWSEGQSPTTGQWLITPDTEGEAIGIGVVGVDAREIPPTRAFVGIRPMNTPEDDGVLIGEVIDGTPADRADLRQDDIITMIDDVQLTDPASLRDTLAQYDPNDPIKMTIIRDEKEMTISFTLADETNVNPDFDRSNSQNSMGSRLSRRRRDFPLAVQHDSQLQASECGGPIVDLKGSVVGLNIARSGRVFSLFLPAETVIPVVEKLKTGEYAPEKVNETNITKTEALLKDNSRLLSSLPKDTKKLKEKIALDEGRTTELRRMITELEDRIKELEKEGSSDRIDLRGKERKLKNAKTSQETLKKNLRKLKQGS